MNTYIINRVKAGALAVASLLALHSSLFTLSSCVETDSSLVEYVDDNKLDSPNDTLYSVVGIINKMQVIADRTVLLGELRGDLASITNYASLDLQDVANFNVKADNPYSNPRDYYAIIQNCNYFIAKADTTLTKRGEKIFEKELGAVRAYRAWTYMQLAMNYGKVPFFTQPILTEKDGDPSLYPSYSIADMVDFFIQDLTPYVDTKYPQYGAMNGMSSQKFFVPVRVLLGDLCLWAGRYKEAATYYHAYLTKLNDTHAIGSGAVSWYDYNFSNPRDAFASQFSSPNGANVLTFIPMMEEEYDGIVCELDDVFCSTEDNNYYYQATYSNAYRELSAAQRYVLVSTDPTTQLRDTISPAADFPFADEIMRGDLRLQSIYRLRSATTNNDSYSLFRQTITKYTDPRCVVLYRLTHVYLRFAEALNRAGIPEAAFAVLKYGLCEENLIKNIGGETVDMLSPATREKAGDLLNFSRYSFTAQNTMGIHSRGSGDADADTTYVIPSLPTLQDSILFVEDKICDEMALETSFEGTRFYDLIRLSQHRNDPSFLAKKVASRNGSANFDAALFTKLSDEKNWFLPLE